MSSSPLLSRVAAARWMPTAAASAHVVSSHLAAERFISTTPPLQKPRLLPPRRKPRKKNKGSGEPKLSRREQLLKEINELKDGDAPKLAPTMETGPRNPVLSRSEAVVELHALYISLLNKGYEHPEKDEIIQEIRLIKTGQLTQEEWRVAFSRVFQETEAVDAKNVVRLLSDKYSKTEHYQKALDYQVANLSDNTSKRISEIRHEMKSEEFNPKLQRIERAVFQRLPHTKKAHREQWREIMFRMERGVTATGSGTSMLPTLPERIRQLSIPIEMVDIIKRGDLCSFVMPKEDGTTVIALKRIGALEDDIVEFKEKKAVVPKNHCWALGDNSKESLDSRQLGALPLENLRSKLVVSYELLQFPPHLKFFGGWKDIVALIKAFTK